MQKLNKKRDFGALIGDSFDVFKKGGKTYFSNYFKINGGILLLLIVLVFLFSRIIIDGIFQSKYSNNADDFLNYIYSNITVFIVFSLLLIIAIVLASIINYLFPIGFLKLINNNEEVTTTKLLSFIKAKTPKAIGFFILSLFTMFPLLIAVVGLNFALCLIIIGFPLLLIVLPAIQCLISLSFYNYLNEDVGFFEAWKNGFRLLKNNLWPNIGATLTMHFIVQTTLGIFIMIPYLFFIAVAFTNPGDDYNDDEKIKLVFMIFFNVIFIISIVGNYLLQNVILVTQGIIYYSSKEFSENTIFNENIDAIGQNNE